MHASPVETEEHVIVNGKLRSTSLGLDGSREPHMTKESWREAHARYTRMISSYCSLATRDDLAWAWSIHFKLIEHHPRFSLDFPTLLLYDIRCRQAHHVQAFNPCVWQDALWHDILDERLLSRPALRPLASSSRPNTDWDTRARPPPYSRPRSASPRRMPLNPCIVCGRSGHRTSDCRPTKSFLVRQGRTWVLPDGKQVCYAWNSNRTGCSGCERVHVCTLCGSRHPMLRCSLFSN